MWEYCSVMKCKCPRLRLRLTSWGRALASNLSWSVFTRLLYIWQNQIKAGYQITLPAGLGWWLRVSFSGRKVGTQGSSCLSPFEGMSPLLIPPYTDLVPFFLYAIELEPQPQGLLLLKFNRCFKSAYKFSKVEAQPHLQLLLQLPSSAQPPSPSFHWWRFV